MLFQSKIISFGADEAQVKLFIILAKYWFKCDVREMFQGARFPSYAIELTCLAIASKEIHAGEGLSLTNLFMKFLHVG